MPKPIFDPENASFRITCGKGFQMTLANGHTVSVQFGPGNYCDNPDRGDIAKEQEYLLGRNGYCNSNNAEFLAWDANGQDVCKTEGWLSPEQIMERIAAVAALPYVAKK